MCRPEHFVIRKQAKKKAIKQFWSFSVVVAQFTFKPSRILGEEYVLAVPIMILRQIAHYFLSLFLVTVGTLLTATIMANPVLPHPL